MTTATDIALEASARTSARGGKYLTFSIGKEEYGLPILKVREIIGYMEITAVPNASAHVKGVINLRGQVIAVIDLRTRFGMETAAKTEETCIIVVEVQQAGVKCSIGIIVDRVSEVLNIPAENIEDPPSFGTSATSDYVMGMGKVGDSVKILLDIDRVLASDEIRAAAEVPQAN